MVGVYFRALLRASRGIHQCLLSRRACRASNLEGVVRGVGVVNRLACSVLLVIARDACLIKRAYLLVSSRVRCLSQLQ